MSEDQEFDQDEAALAELLSRARPAPEAGWARATERGIFQDRERRRRERVTSFGAAGGLAVAVLVASLAGAGPLAPSGGDAAKAKPGCETVFETRVESEGQVVQRADGKVVVESRKAPVQREVTRCR